MNVPFYITASIIGAAAFATLTIPMTIARASKRAALPMNIAATVGLVLGAWFVLSMLLTIAGAYRLVLGDVIPVLGIGLLTTLVGGGVAIAFYEPLRRILSHPAAQSGVIAIQVWRTAGAAFLALMWLGQLPPLFALPAGWGDIAVGLAAPIVALNLHRRGLAIAWNLFGLADLATAIILGATTSPGPVQLFLTTPTVELITEFPLAIIPTFVVPLSILLHLVSLRYLFSSAARSAMNEKALVQASS